MCVGRGGGQRMKLRSIIRKIKPQSDEQSKLRNRQAWSTWMRVDNTTTTKTGELKRATTRSKNKMKAKQNQIQTRIWKYNSIEDILNNK